MNIVILSRDSHLYSTKSLRDAIIKRGHNVRIVNHMKCSLVVESNGKPAIYYQGQPLTNVDAVIPRIGASVTFYGSSVVKHFEMLKVFTTTRSQSLVKSRDKLRCTQIMGEAGVRVPKTVFAGNSKDVDHMIQLAGGVPLIVKLVEGTQGIGVVLAETTKTAKSVIDAFYGLKADFLVQEFIKESAASDIRAFVVGGEVVASIMRKGKKGEFRSNLHRGGEGEVVRLTAAEKKAALCAASALKLSVAGVDMLRSKKGPLVIEVNSSPGLEGIETISGVDVAGKIVELIEREVKKNKAMAKKRKASRSVNV